MEPQIDRDYRPESYWTDDEAAALTRSGDSVAIVVVSERSTSWGSFVVMEARPGEDGAIGYELRDGEGEPWEYTWGPTDEPLTLGEVIGRLDSVVAPAYEPPPLEDGVVQFMWLLAEMNLGDPAAVPDSVRIESDFYPQIALHYERLAHGTLREEGGFGG